ncbi:BZIP transcription factor [Colletotrichum tofieldiae]|nr:bZIP transcription factor [Colletotrichum tofieldiae]GKT73168.1 BZIP transcription factor [Colletotrichum tofieldiae]GKT92438.1 BZIP transcription factor [Colletotrichum tofieldiae]
MSRRKPKSSHRTPTASVRDTDDLRNKSDDVSDKTDLTRARNRKAAYKCRQKKKSKTDDLQSQATEMERTNADLHSEAAILRGEVFELKNMILQHSECECSYITEYIYSAAKNLAQPGMKATASVAGETSI